MNNKVTFSQFIDDSPARFYFLVLVVLAVFVVGMLSGACVSSDNFQKELIKKGLVRHNEVTGEFEYREPAK